MFKVKDCKARTKSKLPLKQPLMTMAYNDALGWTLQCRHIRGWDVIAQPSFQQTLFIFLFLVSMVQFFVFSLWQFESLSSCSEMGLKEPWLAFTSVWALPRMKLMPENWKEMLLIWLHKYVRNDLHNLITCP